MHILMINGSPRKKGATGKLLAALQECVVAENPRASVEIIALSDVKPDYCDGCLYCYRKGHCHNQKDGMNPLLERIAACDALVLASPTYGSSVTGLFKTFVDRSHMQVGQSLYGKPCALVTSYENAQGNRALAYMNQLVMTSGGYSVGKISAKVHFNHDPLTPRIEGQLRSIARRLCAAAGQGKAAKPLFPRVFGAVAFHAVLKPHAQRHPDAYRGILETWKAKKLIPGD